MKAGTFLLLLLAGCASSRGPASPSASSPAEILKQARNGEGGDKSRWRVTDGRLEFSGQLVKGDCDRFRETTAPGIRALKVNSVGGDAFEGLCIAGEMRKRGFTETVVAGLCLSSCANYLFLASPRKVIERGLVGYHGNITALLRQDPQNAGLRAQLEKSGMKKAERDKMLADFIRKQKENSLREKRFLREISVSQLLFDRTQQSDKGTGDAKDYTFLLPLPATFAQYGIREVVGTQDFDLGQAMGMNNLLR